MSQPPKLLVNLSSQADASPAFLQHILTIRSRIHGSKGVWAVRAVPHESELIENSALGRFTTVPYSDRSTIDVLIVIIDERRLSADDHINLGIVISRLSNYQKLLTLRPSLGEHDPPRPAEYRGGTYDHDIAVYPTPFDPEWVWASLEPYIAEALEVDSIPM